MKKKKLSPNLHCRTLKEAFIIFIERNCTPYLEGGGAIGSYNPPFIDTQIRVYLREDGTGYIHASDRDSDTIDFQTVNHFRD